MKARHHTGLGGSRATRASKPGSRRRDPRTESRCTKRERAARRPRDKLLSALWTLPCTLRSGHTLGRAWGFLPYIVHVGCSLCVLCTQTDGLHDGLAVNLGSPDSGPLGGRRHRPSSHAYRYIRHTARSERDSCRRFNRRRLRLNQCRPSPDPSAPRHS